MGFFLRPIVFVAVIWSTIARADDPGSLLKQVASWQDDPATPVEAPGEELLPAEPEGYRLDRQLYVSGIIGASFATLSSGGVNTAGTPTPNTGAIRSDLLTAGGAFGVALDRSNGLLRFEAEGRYRDALVGQTPSAFEPLMYDVHLSDAWSATGNIWRDFFLTSRLGIYGGGGIGAGGYRLSAADPLVAGSSDTSGFAWQAGAGVTYRVWGQTTLDLGYRFFDLATASTPLLNGTAPAGNYASSLSASELVLSVRVYEPFRRIVR